MGHDFPGERHQLLQEIQQRYPSSFLTAEHRTGTVPYRNTFTYDSVGNRLVKNENGARTTYSYDAANQLETSIDTSGTTTYTFDDAGNQQLVQAPSGDRTTTTWDYENKTTLVELPTGIRNTMVYEPDGLRVKLEESTGTKKFIWDDQNYLAEADENDEINVVYTNEPNYYGNLVSQYRKSGAVWSPSYYHYEALGSTRELTDNTEAITDTYLYDAWGNVINSSGSTKNPFQFTGSVGYYFDFDTGNLYIRARIYSPVAGRWMALDPFGFEGGFNLFLYVSNSPQSYIDPSGNRQWVSNRPGFPISTKVTLNVGPWKCRSTFFDNCKEECKKNGEELKGCIWIADVGIDVKHALRGAFGTNFAFVHCCCAPKCPKNITDKSRKEWNAYRDKFRRLVEAMWGSFPSTNGVPWPVHHVRPLGRGGNPIDRRNLIPLHPDDHKNVHKEYNECYLPPGQDNKYSTPGQDWPFTPSGPKGTGYNGNGRAW